LGPPPPDQTPYLRPPTNGLAAELPIWIRAITILGVPSAIAIFLVWVGARELPAMRIQSQANYEAILTTRDLIREHANHTAAMARQLQRICSNTARNEDDRQRCFDQ
jgi:hypothetical protein